jgi:hypothetical protein
MGSDPEAKHSIVDAGKTWQLVFRASEVEHFTRGAAAIVATDSALTFSDGTAVDIIGYEDRPGVIVVTWLESGS